MRMWMLEPSALCRQHLLGEHVEAHMIREAVVSGRSLDGYLRRGLLEPQSLADRHRRLAHEMKRRGYRHDSPLDMPAGVKVPHGSVDRRKARKDLAERCEECSRRMEEADNE